MPRHSDFQEIYEAMQEQYCTGETDETSPKGGPCEKGDQVYYAWLNKHGYDDEKSLDSQKSQTRHIEFDKLFRELFHRLKGAVLSFYEGWLQEHGLDDTVAMSLQKFQRDGGPLYFLKGDDLHVHSNMLLSGSFEKVEGVDDFVVAGYASTCVEDTYGDKFTPDMIRDAAEKYLEEPIVFYCHRWSEPAGLILREYEDMNGKVFKTQVDEVGWFVISRPSKARKYVRDLIEERLLKGYSIGGYYIFDKLGALVGTTIHDVSYVPRPSNKLSYHGIVSRSEIGIHRREEKLEKEEVQALLDEKGKEIVEDINIALDEFKEGLKTEILGAVDEKLQSIEGVSKEDLAALREELQIVSKEDFDAIKEKVETFNKADFDAFGERLDAIEDMPLIKGVGPQTPGGDDDVHKKLAEASSFEEGARIIRGLQR